MTNFLDRRSITPYRITSRPVSTKDSTYHWYKNKYPGLNSSRIRMTENDDIDPDFKINEIKRLGIGVHFEDSYEQAEKIVKHTQCIVVIVPQAWNANYKPDTNRIVLGDEHFPGHLKAVRAFLNLAHRIDKI